MKNTLLFFFLVILLANSLLAFAPLGLETKIGIGLLGILLPWLGAASTPAKPPSLPWKEDRRPSRFPNWSWIFLVILGAGVRLYHLTSLPVWPMWDDAFDAFFSLQQLQHWSFQMFVSPEKIPFLFFWIQALYFNFFSPSLGTLWLFPTLFSILALPVGYWACRQYFSRAFSLLCLGILAFSFWPVYLGQFCLGSALGPAWEFIALGLLGLFWKSLSGRSSVREGLLLGLWLGLGFYTSITALPAVGLTAAAALGITWKKKNLSQALALSGVLLVPMALLLLPLAPGFWSNLTTGHVHEYMVMDHTVDPARQASTSLSYWMMILWGVVHPSYFNFGPLWGGFLNPLLGSAFLLGWAGLYQARPARLSGFPPRVAFWGMAAVFLVYLVPASLTNSLESMRIDHLMPFSLLLAALGLWRLLQSFPGGWKEAVLAIFFLVSISLDAYHLLGPYHQWAVPGIQSEASKSAKRYRAYQVLVRKQAQEGPGLILTEFIPNVFDQSLLVATYPFNAARNPRLDPGKARWAALLEDFSFQNYFRRVFPDCQTYPLFQGIPTLEGNLTLFVFPLDAQTMPTMERWLEAHRQIQDLFGLIPYHQLNPDLDLAIQSLRSCSIFFEKDPFLESSYLEKRIDLEEKDPRYGSETLGLLKEQIRICGTVPGFQWRKGYFLEMLAEHYQKFQNDDRQAVQSFDGALRTGYESPKLYKQLMVSEVHLGNFKRALWAARQAGRLTPEDPAPPELVQWLQNQTAAPGGQPAAGRKP